jgi:hypothetical protein
VQNCFGNVVGIASGICTGWLVQHMGSFVIPFIAASGACLLGAASFWLLVREKRTEIFSFDTTPQVCQ